jgi:hypothetical protein
MSINFEPLDLRAFLAVFDLARRKNCPVTAWATAPAP